MFIIFINMGNKYRIVPKLDLTGKIFGRLKVIEFEEYKKIGRHRFPYWKVECSCGVKKSVRQNSLVSMKLFSCGCLLDEFRKNILPALTSKRNSIAEGESSLNNIICNYKNRAKKNNINFDLTKEDFRKLTKQKCHYCGVEPSQKFNKKYFNGHYIYNGIDRKDNTIGYTIDNSLPCCGICNKAKRDLTYDKFISWIKIVKNHTII